MLLAFNINALAEGEGGSIVSSAHGSTYVIKNDGSFWGWGSFNGYINNQQDPIWLLRIILIMLVQYFKSLPLLLFIDFIFLK